MKYKHIIFDIDGTLIDTEYAVLHSLQETIKGLSGREIPCSELRFALGITGTDALKKLEIKDTSYAIELWDKNMRNYTNTIKVFDGIIELLKNLLSLDYEMGIVTSKTREEFTHDFCPFGISHYFKTIICADDTQEHKPNAAPILKYVELSKTDHSKVLYIGDSKYDSKCAEDAGIDFALAVWGSHNKHIKADYFLDLLTCYLLSLQRNCIGNELSASIHICKFGCQQLDGAFIFYVPLQSVLNGCSLNIRLAPHPLDWSLK